MTTVYQEVVAATKLQPKAGETLLEFSQRLAERINDDKKFPEDAYTALSPDAQNWVKAVIDALDAKKDLPALPGADEKKWSNGKADSAPKDQKQEEEEEEKKPAKKAKTTASAKKAGAKKKPEKKAAVKRAPGGGRKGLAVSGKIKLLVEENPRRKNGKLYKVFEKIMECKTSDEALSKGVTVGQLRGAIKRKYIQIVA